MKLETPNATKKLDELLNKFGAIHKPTPIGNVLITRDDIGSKLDGGEAVEISFELIDVLSDGTLSVQGRRVLVYIRDQNIEHVPYKFHVANCRTLIHYQSNGAYEKYVASLRIDGYFKFNIVSSDSKSILEKRVEPLGVCRNCLSKMNFEEYNYLNRLGRNFIFENFSIDHFFEKYPCTVLKPKHTDATSPKNLYRDIWPEKSRNYKNKHNYICEDCGIDFSGRKRFLHVHHINSRKDNNDDMNLEALCVKCHSKRHLHLKVPSDYPY